MTDLGRNEAAAPAPAGVPLDAPLLRHALGQTTDGVVIVDALQPDLPIVYANRGFEALTGYSEAEVLGRNCRFLQGPGTDPDAVGELRDAIDAARETRIKILNYGREGGTFWNEICLSPVLDADGRMVQMVGVLHDCTAEVEARSALRDEEANYRALAEGLDAGVVLVGADGRVLAGNRAAAEILGVDPDTMTGASIEDPRGHAVLSGGSPVSIDEHPAVVSLRTGRPMNGIERAVRRADGEIVRLLVNTRPIWRADEAEPYAAVASFTDISDQRRSEAELRRRAEIIDQVDAGVIVVDTDWLVTHWNRGAERMYGWSRDEVLGQRVGPEIIAPSDREGAAAAAAEVEAGRPYEGEIRLRRRDGEEFTAYQRNVPIHGAEGLIEGFVGVSIDLTEQERARDALEASREALQETERRLRAVVDVAPMVLWALDAEGTIVLLEGQRLDAMGIPRDGTIGRSIYDVFVDLEGVMEENRRALGGEAFSSVSEVGERCFEIRYLPTTDDDGAVTGVVAVGIDVTERMEDAREREALEARLRQVERLESVGQLAGGIAHDFNNLLAVILNYASFALEEGAAPAAVREDVAEIRRAAERAAALTRQLLLFSRRQVAEPTVIHLEEVIDDMEQLLRRTLGEHIRLKTIVGSAEHPVRIDHGEVEQVVMNLVLNARDAMPDGGEMIVETGGIDLAEAEAEVRGLAPGRYLCLRVRDTGHGMDEDVRARAFEPFFSTKSRDKGSGLGLATVYGIAQRAEGHVRVESTPGEGTMVELLLPAAEGQEAVPPDPPAHRAQDGSGASGGATILVVEDEDAVRKVIRRSLARRGHIVYEACDGREALERHAEHGSAIDLLLTDVVLPELSGSEVATRLQRDSPDLRVLFMSGYTDDVVFRRGVEQGEMAFLAKPFTPTELQRRVEETLAAPR